MANNQTEPNVLRTFFRSEITWIISIIIAVWAFVTTVVLPIQKLQLNVENIQYQLASESKRYLDTENRVTNLEKNEAVVMSTLSLKKTN